MEKHDLHHEFPEFDQKIHELKVSDHHFKKLFDDYHAVNDTIHRIETDIETASDEVLNGYRSQRVHLKDELYALLTK